MRNSVLTLVLLLIFSDTRAQNFWEQTSGPEGGAVNCLAVDRDNRIFSGFDVQWFGTSHQGKGFYRSENEGSTWESLYLYSNKDIQSIAIDTLNAIYIWVGGHGVHKSTDNGRSWIFKSSGLDDDDGTVGVFKNNYVVFGQDGIYISTNGGTTWNAKSLTQNIHSIFIDNEDNLFASLIYGGLYISSDYGETWHQSDQGLFGRVDKILQFHDSIYYACSSSGIFRSDNRGQDWILIPGSPSNVSSLCIGSHDRIFAGTKGDGFFCSSDEGVSWTSRNNGLRNYYITSLLRISSGSIIAGTYGDGMYITTNHGINWRPINNGVISTHITAFFKYKEYLFAGSEHGMIYKSSDRGDTWIRNDTNNTFMPITAFCKSTQNTLFYSTYYYLFKEEYNGDHWEHSGPDLQNINNEKLETGKLFKSDDEGKTWQQIPGVYYVKAFSTYFDSLSGIEYLLAADARGLYISKDDGKSWNPINGLPAYIEKVGTNSLGYFYVSSQKNIFRSTDFGESWQIIYTGDVSVYNTTFEIARNNYIYAGLNWGNVILSTDYGNTWVERSIINFVVHRINSLAVDSIGNVFAADWEGGIYQSNDEGRNWRSFKSGMIGGAILNLFCDNEGNIFVGPYGGGVFRGVTNTLAPLRVKLASPVMGNENTPVNPMLKWYASPSAVDYRYQVSLNNHFDSLSIIHDGIVNDTSIILDSLNEGTIYLWRIAGRNEYGWGEWSNAFWFKTILTTAVNDNNEEHFSYNLAQNYPNPFNPSTTIHYSLAEKSPVIIKIFDILGCEVQTIVNSEKPAGNYELKWDASSLSSGIYFYRIQAGMFIETKKMILMR